ncbi:MAG TPA: ABC transporter substrate-binding protein [Acidimicrobiia bacterium]|jgi:branched-chain amino acid transport system substrate-binding protein
MASRTWRLLIGAAVVGSLFAGACSSSSSNANGAGGTTKTTVDLSALGPAKQATGAPLKLGYIYAGEAQGQDNRPELAMAQATAKYVNDHLGGIAGRPIQFVTCADHLTPSGATDCANQMLAAKVPAVLSAQPSQPAPIIKLLAPAKVAFFTWQSADASGLIDAGSFVMGNPIAILAAPIKVAKDTGAKKVGVLYVDLPAAAQLKILAGPMYKKAHVGLVTTAAPLGTPDLTPQMQSLLSAGADEFLVVGDLPMCVNALKALKTLGFNGKVISNFNCLADPSAKAIPGGFSGLMALTTRTYGANDPDVKLLNAIAAKYAPAGTPTGDKGGPGDGFAVVLGFVRAMSGLAPGNATPAGMSAALLAMQPAQLPFLEPNTFQCNRKQASLTPAVCSNVAALSTIAPSGAAIKSVIINAKPYL